MAADNASAGWWQRNGKTVVLLLIFFAAALFIRSYFNYEASYNDGEWRWSGTDPYYHMRVVDHIRETGEFLLRDGLINYPVGAMNPRPPIFDWTIAAAGGLLAPFFNGDNEASSAAAAAFSPAVWGALTVFPMYMLGAAAFGRKAGLWAAFFIAVMASNITRSNLGAVDHDATILFFLVLSAFFLVKALQLLNRRVYIEDYRRTNTIGPGYRSFFKENQASVLYAVLAGASIAAIALTWQGFAYAYAIFAVWYGFQLLSNHLRGRDSTGHFVLAVVTFLTTLVMIWGYYDAVVRIQSYVYPLLYIFAGVLIASLVFVPTRHLPPILVLPLTAAAALIGLLVLLFVLPDIGRLFFTGLGYFVQTKLYSTIAEAQRTPIGYLVFSTGIIPFFFGLAGIVLALVSAIRKKRDDHLYLFVWAGLALIMSFAATRFVYNASVGFALMAGWMTARFIAWIRFGEVRKSWRNVRSAGYNLFRSTRTSVGVRHVLGALFIVVLLLVPTVWGGVDAGMPGAYVSKQLRDADPESAKYDFWTNYFGAFGQDFLSSDWTDSLAYLRAQDTSLDPIDRPAFIAWWDYGFYAVQKGEHPTVADPFQFGFEVSGRFIASQTETEAIAIMTARLLEGNYVHGDRQGRLDDDARQVLDERRAGLADELEPLFRVRDYDGVLNALLGVVGAGEGEEEDTTEAVSLYRDARRVTGDSIRYFALEGRMFPCDDPRTQGIDSGSIFYAPIFLADKNPEDFVRTMYTDGSGQNYFQRIYETTEDGGSRQIDDPYVVDNVGNRYLIGGGRIYPMAAGGQVDYNSPLAIDGIPLEREELQYQRAFYNTLFYRAWVGLAPENLDDKVPPASAFSPGQDLKHFRLVYSTVRTDASDNFNRCFDNRIGGGYASGVQILKYYDGAPISGTVLDSEGQPMAGATVRVADNFGIVHDQTQADAEGRWELMAPFSTETDPAERAGQERQNTLRATGLNQLQVVSGGDVIVSEEFAVSEEQAMGEGPDIEPFALEVRLGTIEGIVFEDTDGDGVLNETDPRVGNATVRIGDREVQTDGEGRYRAEGVAPGQRTVTATASGYQDGTATANLSPGGTAMANVSLEPAPVNVTGALTHDGSPIEGATVRFSPDQDDPNAQEGRTSLPADENGTYEVVLPPRTWYATVDFQTEEGDATVRYYTESALEVEVGREPMTFDIELQREEL